MANRLLHIILLFPHYARYGQNTIGPDVVNYYKGTYNAGLQNWDRTGQDNGQRDHLFANNEGFFSFDGRYWELYPLPNKTIVRSLRSDRIIVYMWEARMNLLFFPGFNGRLTYHSLVGKFCLQPFFFWCLGYCQRGWIAIFFRTPSKNISIYQWVNGRVSASGEWAFMDFVMVAGYMPMIAVSDLWSSRTDYGSRYSRTHCPERPRNGYFAAPRPGGYYHHTEKRTVQTGSIRHQQNRLR